MVHTIESRIVNKTQALPTSYRQCSATYTLSSDERIATMEAELFNLRRAKKFKLRPSELEHNTTTEQQPTRALTNRMFNRLEEQYHESRKWKMKKQHRNSRQFRLRILSQPSQSTRTETLETPPMHLQSTETLQYQTSRTMGNDPTLLTRLCHRYTIQQ